MFILRNQKDLEMYHIFLSSLIFFYSAHLVLKQDTTLYKTMPCLVNSVIYLSEMLLQL